MDENDLVAMSDAMLYRTLVEACKSDLITNINEGASLSIPNPRTVPDTETIMTEVKKRDAESRGISDIEVEMDWAGGYDVPSFEIWEKAIHESHVFMEKTITKALSNERSIV